MKARIGVMSEELIRKRMLDVAAGTIENEPNTPKFWFTSLAAVAQLLCKENVDLLMMIEEHEPQNLTELAKVSGRQLSNLSVTIKSLASKGFVRLENHGRAVRPIALYTDFEIIMGESLERSTSAGHA